MTINHDRQRKEDTHVNSNNDTQQNNMEEHVVNGIPANSEQEENLRHIPVHGNRDQPDENNNTNTQYGRIVEKPICPLLSLGYTFHTPVGSGHAQ